MQKFSLKGREFILLDLRLADVDKYMIFFNELSEESVRCRFGHLLAKLTKSAAEQRTRGDAESEKAVAVFDGQQDRIVAIGRCSLDAKAEDAEVALVVSETMRRLGLGRFLLHQLIRIAQNENSRSISAFIATKNAPVIKLLQSAGFVMQPANHGDDLRLVLKISPEGLTRTHPTAESSDPEFA